MTRRDFNLIAGVIRQLPAQVSRDTLARAFAAELLATNRAFDVARFLAACDPKAPTQTPAYPKRVFP